MVTKKPKGLGRGLDALLGPSTALDMPASGVPATPAGTPMMARLAELAPGPYQPRTRMDEGALYELAESIKAQGIMQPILVRRDPGDPSHYEIIAGERRWRAAQVAQVHEVPVLVREMTDREALEVALVENLQRQDLSPLEEAEGYQRLMDEFAHTQEALGQAVGKSRSHVANTLRLLNLPAPVKALVGKGDLSAGHARALLGTPDRAFQEQLARRTVERGLSVREDEEAVRRREAAGVDDGDRAAPGSSVRPAGLLELEDLLAQHLDTRVGETMGARKGRVVIEFATLEDLERIYRAMVHGRPGDPDEQTLDS